jgi:hypothetical protein
MTRVLAITLMALLTACTIAPPERGPDTAPAVGARPVSAILYKQALTVIYDDGALCAADRPVAKSIWGSALSGCPHLHSFTVEEVSPLTSVRLPLRLGEAGAGAQVKLAVVIADGSVVNFAAP